MHGLILQGPQRLTDMPWPNLSGFGGEALEPAVWPQACSLRASVFPAVEWEMASSTSLQASHLRMRRA